MTTGASMYITVRQLTGDMPNMKSVCLGMSWLPRQLSQGKTALTGRKGSKQPM
jgi:hypothetical protein